MSVIIDGTNGISDVDGSASTPAIRGTDANTGIFFPAADTIAFAEGGTESMRLDSSGNVIVNGYTSTGSTNSLRVGNVADYQGRFYLDSSPELFYIENTSDYSLSGIAFKTNASERMRITSGGDVLINATATGMANGGIQSLPAGNAANVPFFGCAGNSSSSSYISYGLYSTSLSQYQFYVGYNGTIAARSTSITGLSDVSEKENIKPLETGLDEVLALQPRRFDWKNGSGQNIAGFVAQEVETVLPDLVEEYKIDNETIKKGLKMGDMLPTLVKAIQELKAELDEAKAEIAALKNSQQPVTE